MKVQEFLKKFNMGSNATVTVLDTNTDKEYRMFYDQLRYEQYYKYTGSEKIDIGAMRFNSFTVRDNALTIFAE